MLRAFVSSKAEVLFASSDIYRLEAHDNYLKRALSPLIKDLFILQYRSIAKLLCSVKQYSLQILHQLGQVLSPLFAIQLKIKASLLPYR